MNFGCGHQVPHINNLFDLCDVHVFDSNAQNSRKLCIFNSDHSKKLSIINSFNSFNVISFNFGYKHQRGTAKRVRIYVEENFVMATPQHTNFAPG